MDPVSVLLLVCTGVALYAGGLHGWLHLWHGRESEHLWLAVTALGVAAVSAGNLGVYGAADVAEAERWQRAMFAASTPILVGFLRFSFHFLGVRRPWLDRAGLAFALLVVTLCLGTELVFSGQPLVRDLRPLGPHFVESRLDPAGHVLILGFLGFFSAAVWLYARRLRRASGEVRIISATLLLWFVAGANDGAVALELYPAPYTLAVGYLAIVVGVSHVLVRRFVTSLREVERLAALLRDRVPERELALVRGERDMGVGTLAASVAHEINNPLAFVQSNLNRLEELWAKADAPGTPRDADAEADAREVAEILAESREGAERVQRIVAELLSLARSREGGSR